MTSATSRCRGSSTPTCRSRTPGAPRRGGPPPMSRRPAPGLQGAQREGGVRHEPSHDEKRHGRLDHAPRENLRASQERRPRRPRARQRHGEPGPQGVGSEAQEGGGDHERGPEQGDVPAPARVAEQELTQGEREGEHARPPGRRAGRAGGRPRPPRGRGARARRGRGPWGRTPPTPWGPDRLGPPVVGRLEEERGHERERARQGNDTGEAERVGGRRALGATRRSERRGRIPRGAAHDRGRA